MAYTTIKKSSDYFNTKLWSGNGGTQSITGVGFQPDWLWLKSRTQAVNHYVFDAVRGVTKGLTTNTTSAESTKDSSWVTSFDSNGFSLGSEANINTSSATYASWNWKANGAGVANTDGSINSTVSANTTSGFSIVSYTGNGTGNSTIGHGLGATPKFIIVKNLTTAQDWGTYSPSFVSASDPNVVYLSKSSAQADDTNVWGTSATFNNNTFTVGDWTGSNQSGSSFIAYCFADVQGFSKFGSYVGNGSGTDGTFVYTGFKPAFLIVKNIDAAEAWGMHDNKRPGLGNGNAPVGHFELQPNLSNVENSAGAAGQIDFLSNGFKLRTATNSLNVTQNYIYMAFASEPLVGDNPTTAR